MEFNLTNKLFKIKHDSKNKDLFIRLFIETPKNTFDGMCPIEEFEINNDFIILKDATSNNSGDIHLEEVYIRLKDIISIGFNIVDLPK